MSSVLNSNLAVVVGNGLGQGLISLGKSKVNL